MDLANVFSLNTLDGILTFTVYHNTLLNWSIAGAITLIAYLAFTVLTHIVAGRLYAISRITKIETLNFIGSLVKSANPLALLALSMFIGSQVLDLPKGVENLVRALPILAILGQVAFWGNKLTDFLLNCYVETKETEEDRLVLKTMLGPVKFVMLLVFWSVLLLMALDNLGIDVTALVAGLGIGGVAIALAVQNILSDLFAALSIVIDKPFVVGDFIIVGDFLGTVEHIGLKTTRVAGLGGERLIFCNSDLLTSRIRNYKHMRERRVVFQFKVVYQTPCEKLERIPGIIREIIEKIDLARLDRAHFKGFGDSSLDFEVVYHVLKPEYDVYMDVQQTINLKLIKEFQKLDIHFAHPIRMVYMPEGGPVTNGKKSADITSGNLEAKAS